MAFPDVANTWMAEPSAQNLAALQASIQSQPNYTTGPNFAPAAEALRRRDFRRALDEVESWMPGAFLSPLAHSMLAQALVGLDRLREADLERRLARAAMVSIFNSGDGSKPQPWTVLRVSDEYDILTALGEQAQTQTPIEASGQLLDRISTDRGSTHWFAILHNGRRSVKAAA